MHFVVKLVKQQVLLLMQVIISPGAESAGSTKSRTLASHASVLRLDFAILC